MNHYLLNHRNYQSDSISILGLTPRVSEEEINKYYEENLKGKKLSQEDIATSIVDHFNAKKLIK